MAAELPKSYDAPSVEKKWQDHWADNETFKTGIRDDREPFVIYIPPPNVTGALHMGHVLNYTIQDIVIRWRRMTGREALWLPGLDHAGIATQNVVEKALRKEGLSRHDLGREKFVERVWEWKDQHGGRILEQFRTLGASFDLSRLRFTLDDDYYKAVMEAFVHLYKKGIVYRGDYITSWCPRCHTVLADEEVDHTDRNGSLWHISYPLEGGGEAVVATTRPETMLGDTGIAIHPDNPKTAHLKGKKAILPLLNRVIPIVEDERVDPEFGTGCVKLTPAHDPLDFEIGKDHQLEAIKIFDENAVIREGIGRFGGMSRDLARKEVVADLEEAGVLIKKEKHRHAVGQCYRCDTLIEPWLSTQWFVAMKELAAPAIDVVREGKLRLFPERWEKVYYHWMENIRDWCVSRQLWWGHRIPAWYCKCGEMIVEVDAPGKCPQCGAGDLVQDEDVLDTWASSWLWPFATLGWPKETPELKYFFPSHLLVTGGDIIFFWVARMVMSSLEFMGEVPFTEVYFNGIVRDSKGRKLSKSLGNSPDPKAILQQYGADAVRFSSILTTPPGQDQVFSEEKLETGRRFANKIWNATRFVLPHTEGVDTLTHDPASISLPERWILSRLTAVQRDMTSLMGETRLNEAAYAVYDFLWHDYCDWFVEMSKSVFTSDTGGESTREVLLHILREGVLLLAPFMPHLAEELGTYLGVGDGAVSLAKWNDGSGGFRDKRAEREMAAIQSVVGAVRTIRSESNVPPQSQVRAMVHFLDESARQPIEQYRDHICALGKISDLDLDATERPQGSIASVSGTMEVFVPLEGLVDIDKERQRLQKEADRLTGEITRIGKKLSNEQYLGKAPEEVVEKDRNRERSYREMLSRIQLNLDGLG